MTRTRAIYEGMVERGVVPQIGTIVPGSGLAVGADFQVPRIAGLPVGAGVEGKISVRGYREAALRVGLLAHRRNTSSLRAADDDLSSLFIDGRKNRPGLAIFVERRQRHLAALSMFGFDPQGAPMRADYGRASTTTDAILQWQRTDAVGVGARVGLLTAEMFPGTSDTQQNAEVAFSEAVGEAPFAQVQYLVAAVGASFDRRDLPGAPTRGVRVDGLMRRFISRTATQPSFTRVSVDLRGFQSLSTRHVLAARVLASTTVGDTGDIPFYLMESLGGGHTMRAFNAYRLRGERLIALSVESRWRVSRFIELAPFLDAGAVEGAPVPGTPHGLLLSPGIGVRARTQKRIVLRADAAFGSEGGRLAFAIDTPF